MNHIPITPSNGKYTINGSNAINLKMDSSPKPSSTKKMSIGIIAMNIKPQRAKARGIYSDL